MSLRDTKTSAALEAALDMVRATVGRVVSEAPTILLGMMREATTYHERSQLAMAQSHLLGSQQPLIAAFGPALREKVDEDLAATGAVEPAAAGQRNKTDWDSISLVDDGKVEEDISFGRIGQFITHECDAELRELSGHMSALLRHGRADPERNPVRGAVIGWAVHRAIEKVTPDVSTQRIIAKELGHLIAKAMRPCYAAIIEDMRSRGVRAAELVARMPVDRPRGAPGAVVLSEEAVKNWERSLYGRLVVDAGDDTRGWDTSLNGRLPAAEGQESDPENSAALLDSLMRGGVPGSMGAISPLGLDAAQAHADVQFGRLVRRLSHTLDSVRGSLDSGHGTHGGPTNLIRAHRDELQQASPGKLDHMVIEVVSSLFDQILSDPHVPPQMARQIARLQLPVLRVAMRDPAFFASRRHPVRRFINRVSSLGSAMEGFDSGAGLELLNRVHGLIQQIVDGDFEQTDVFEEQLLELEKFTAEQARAEIKAGSAAETLQLKELEWRLLSRFSEQLRGTLEPLPLDTYLKEFLSQTWAQVILAASLQDGADSPAARRFRIAGYELTVSLQPKRSVDDRNRFIATLPGLMAALNEGMALIGWPRAARDAFFGKLITGHAGSLKSVPPSDLDFNLLIKRLQTIFRTPIPSREDAAATTVSQSRAPIFEQHFSPEEAKNVGLIAETAVDWSREVAPDPVATAALAEEDAAGIIGGAEAAIAAARDADDPAEPVDGLPLRDHLQVGFSYQLFLHESWEKVRLTYMSPGRNFFMFTHGSKDRRSISMTARMLDRLCETLRMRAFEHSFLIDRATQRARRQLAQVAPVG